MDWSDDSLRVAKNEVLVENTAQAVFKHLERLENNRSRFGARWVWELVQNARDAARAEGVAVEIMVANDGLEFRHSGDPFEPKEIVHLIFHGSTKFDTRDDLARFGSGFLSTHLLSRVVGVRGRLTDGRSFEFNLDRSGETVGELSAAMERSWIEFENSCKDDPTPDLVWTTYDYPLRPEVIGFVHNGLEAVRRLGALILSFSPEIRAVAISGSVRNWRVSRVGRRSLTDGIDVIEVAGEDNGESFRRKIAIASDADDLQAVLPLRDASGGLTADLDQTAQRLFILFPLLTTEHLALPVVINGRRFWPHEDRDGIVLDSTSARGAENKELLRRAALLMVRLLTYGAEAGWQGLERLVGYDSTHLPDWVDSDWFHAYLREVLAETRRLPLVRTADGDRVRPADAWIPFDNSANCREQLRELAASWDGGPRHLPHPDEMHTWFGNLQRWTELEPEDGLSETFTISRLAELVHSSTTVAGVNASLGDGRDVFSWLRAFFTLIHATERTAFFDELSLLPSQAGKLLKRGEILRDSGIPEALKEIAAEFGVDLREGLLDVRASTRDLVSLQPMTEEAALEDALAGLRQAIDDGKLPLELTAGNAALFWWITHAPDHHDRLDGFPLVTADEADGVVAVRELQRDRERAPLAPPAFWPASARRFESLFPRRGVLHPTVGGGELTAADWRLLVDAGFVRLEPLFEAKRKLDTFLSDTGFGTLDDDLTHESVAEVAVSDLAFLTEKDSGLIDTARKSRSRTLDVLEFIAGSIIEEDEHAFEEILVHCDCGREHRAFRAAWLVPLRERKWLSMGEGRTAFIAAETLASVASDRDQLIELFATERGTMLLQALGVSPADFQLRALAADEQERAALVRSMSDLAQVAGSFDRLELLAREIHDYPEHIQAIEQAKERRKKVEANQRLGRLVEDLLQQELRSRGLRVARTGVGSDFEVESDFTEDGDREIWLEIAGGPSSVLVEVKSARSDRVRMTPTQAETAHLHRARFALCVVPLPSDSPTPDLVRDASKFVFQIGALLEEPLRSYHAAATANRAAQQTDGQIDVEISEGQTRFAVGEGVWQSAFSLRDAIDEIARRSALVGLEA